MPRPCSSSSISVTLRLPHQSCGSREIIRSASISRESSGPRRSSSRSRWRLKRAFVSRNSVPRRSYICLPRRRRIRARISGKSSIGQMNAPHSNSLRSSHSSRSSSATSYGPSRLQSTSVCGVAMLEIGSIWRNPSLRTVSRTFVALPSSNCARTAMRRASARLTVFGGTTPAAVPCAAARARTTRRRHQLGGRAGRPRAHARMHVQLRGRDLRRCCDSAPGRSVGNGRRGTG
jgi:hypothetical protein